jgi:hypothetical protein
MTINNDKIIVNNGLTAGEQIVVQGVQKLKDKSPVTLISGNKK